MDCLSFLLRPLAYAEVGMRQALFPPLVPTIALTEDEYSYLMSEYRRAIYDVWCGILGNDSNTRPNLFQIDAKLLVYGRSADGTVRAAVRVHTSDGGKPYRRSLRVVTGRRGAAPRTVHLRVVL